MADSIVQSLKASPQTTCYVNPADLDDALLNRDLGGSMAFWILFPAAFIGMPGLGFYGYVRNLRQKKRGWLPATSTIKVENARRTAGGPPFASRMGQGKEHG